MTQEIDSQRYRLVEQVLTDGDIQLSLYTNEITGLRVVTAQVECPIVKGDLIFATEAFDDDGLPHTLEHLIFLGSEDYPYKGVLDLLANRSLADGTNAMTDTDHTDYTISTAGSEGFLNILPIYLDHVLFPTLSDAGFITEVHHINGDGEDAGVVYSEMQARENSGDSRCYLEMARSLYPGKSGYKSETGGLVENIRTSTDNIKVRNYHKEFYHAKNLCVLVTGPVEAADIFKAIKPIEDKIVRKGDHLMKFDRPWQTPVEPLPSCIERKLKYSSDTDDDGLVYVGYRGPNVVTSYKEFLAITVVLDYLNSTAISPIQRDFVESDKPYCSSVDHSVIEYSTSCFFFSFESVGKENLDKVMSKLNQLLINIVDKKEKFDMERLKTIISRKIVKILSIAETSPHAIVIGPVVGHFLYGEGEIKERCKEIPILREFGDYSEDNWLELINKYMIGPEARYACIVGEPSSELMQFMSDAEKNRIAEQKERLKDKLPELGERLRLAIETNEKPAPNDLLRCVPVPSTDSIKFHPIERVVLDTKSTPFRFNYDSIKTSFISINVLMDTSHILTKQDRLYLPILSELILESPIERNGTIVPYETVVAEMFSDTVVTGTGIGLSSSSSYSVGAVGMLFGVAMQVEIDKYEKAVNWFHEVLYKTVFTAERIKTVATRLVSDISQHKRSGSKVSSALINALAYQSNSNQWATNFMRQQKFLKKMLADLKTNPNSVQENITRIRDLMNRPNNMLVHLTLNKSKVNVDNILDPWLKVVPDNRVTSAGDCIQLERIIPSYKLLEPIKESKAAIVGVGSVESNYLQQIVKSIDSYDHPDLAALYVFIQYLTQLEGPMWRLIRGAGLSYNYQVHISPPDGILSLILFKATQLVASYQKAKEIVLKYLEGEEEFEDNLFESAKSSLIFEFIQREKSAAGRSLQSLLAYLRNLDIDFNRELIKRVEQVTKEDLRRAFIHLKPLFDDPERLTAVCCHPSKLSDISNGLSELGCKVEKISLEESDFLNSIEQ